MHMSQGRVLDGRVLGVFFLLFLVLYISFLVICMPTYFSFVIEITACLYLCSL